jgi:hypothetical protein
MPITTQYVSFFILNATLRGNSNAGSVVPTFLSMLYSNYFASKAFLFTTPLALPEQLLLLLFLDYLVSCLKQKKCFYRLQ